MQSSEWKVLMFALLGSTPLYFEALQWHFFSFCAFIGAATQKYGDDDDADATPEMSEVMWI